MTDEQTDHIGDIVATFKEEATKKYTAGVKEHGGNLWDVPSIELINMAMEEAIDSYVYLFTLREQIQEARATAKVLS